MNTSMIKGVAVGGVAMVMLGAGAVGGYKAMSQPQFADVVAVSDVVETFATPKQKCEDVRVQHRAPVQDQHRIAGTVIGGLAGGLLGSNIGGGRGRTIATVAGAAAGGYAGNQVQKNMQERDVVTKTERHCRTVTEKSHKVVGYKVTYRLDGKEGVTRMSFKPGPKLPVKDGHVITMASPNKMSPADAT
jgi:uncharacterized protein YcfJ